MAKAEVPDWTPIDLVNKWQDALVNTWKVDRSRYLTGLQECMMKRYLQYHSGPTGYGWVPMHPTIHQTVGNEVHELLSFACMLAWDAAALSKFVDPVLRTEITISKHRFYKTQPNYEEKGPLFLDEQWALIEGIVWAWVIHILPGLIEKYELVSTEQEYTVKISDVIQMTRPDLILRSRETKKLSNHDFKTNSAKLTDYFVKAWITALQMAIGCYAVEQTLGEPVESYYIHSLGKGGRGVFKKKGSKDSSLGYAQQYSDFCYANLSAPLPPVTDTSTITFAGLWFDKTPVWEMDIIGKPANMTNSEYVARMMGPKELSDIFGVLGPYPNNPNLIEDYKLAMPEHEGDWRDNLLYLYNIESEEDSPWQSEEFQEELSAVIPRSYNCFSYNNECDYKRLCFREPGWTTPEAYFKVRTPHHEAEAQEFAARVPKTLDTSG